MQLPLSAFTPVFDVVQDGNMLTGTYRGALGESPVSGTIEGNSFRLTFTAAGVEAEYAGTLRHREILGDRIYLWSASIPWRFGMTAPKSCHHCGSGLASSSSRAKR